MVYKRESAGQQRVVVSAAGESEKKFERTWDNGLGAPYVEDGVLALEVPRRQELARDKVPKDLVPIQRRNFDLAQRGLRGDL